MSTSVESPDAWTGDPRVSLVDQVCSYLERTHSPSGDAGLLCDFAREFYSKVPRQLLVERSVEDLAAVTAGAFEFLQRADPDGANVEITDPSAEGWEAPVTIIRAEVGDRPFIVDTIREFLAAEKLPIQHYIYPIVRVERTDDGRIRSISPGGGENSRAFTHCEVPRIEDPRRCEALRHELQSRLSDVVAATDDFQPMRQQLLDTVELVDGYKERFPDRAAEFEEVEEFLRWLYDENFVFLGYREYEMVGGESDPVVRVVDGSGLGILSREEESTWADGVPLPRLSDELRSRFIGGPVLITSKTNAEATVHRRARMDYVGVKVLSDDGEVAGERRFLGLYTSKAYADHADTIPILRRKLEGILRDSGAIPGSHDYKEIITIFNSMPKEDLFQASLAELEKEVQTVLSLLFTDEVRVTLRRDPLGRGVSVMVILPRGRFSAEVRHRIQDVLIDRLEGAILNYHLAMSAGDQARLHFYVSTNPVAFESISAEGLASDIRHIIRSWDDRLFDALLDRFEKAPAHRIAETYREALQDEYRAATTPEVAAQDLEEIEALRERGERVGITLREPPARRADALGNITILKLYLIEQRLILSDFMPILENAGLRVIEVTPFSIAAEGLPETMIYTFSIQDPEGTPIPRERAELLAEALLAIRRGDTQNDPFSALVIRAGLRWREVDILRAYGNYAFQAGVIPTRYAPARALARHPELGRLLVEYFRARFDPDGLVAEEEALMTRGRSMLRAAINGALDGVSTLSDDRAIRRLVTLIEGTVRTNYFRHGGADPTARSGGVPYISLKIRSGDVDELRRDRLLFEIFVFSSRMEGVHLRGAPVSRGGIRWSDRPDDFRTEVLGLVQTQIVKNAVIVPGGSKGGFVTKRIHEDRQEMMEEVAEQYRTLIRGMLDLTDNIVEGEVVHPEGVVRHDGDDPYLVVAADKGTAHLSDVANAVSAEYGFWLGDAFASGGSNGYDHKKEGITARGAWECVKRHFREMGKDIQVEPFTVSGIGDMSGDVFGNGMLLSEQIRLVAAFDHRHIFIDPEPDTATTFAERKRLFEMGRSSWDDYDQSLLSAGGMIVPRAIKEVELTPEARSALGIPETVERLDGESLVRAVLAAPTELLWNGGIGTYVKSATETHAEVGDPGNDPVRINSDQLRCQVIGEGGNLGLTQSARIDFALRGGRINTDALDNSAGVDMSDHEVNLKILLTPIVTEGGMTEEARNALLEQMTDEVSELVLHNNFHQSLAVSLDEVRSREALGDFTALISSLERQSLLERTSEGIPGADELEERDREGTGLTRPTLCVLLAYAKLQAKSELLGSDLLAEPSTDRYLTQYFPQAAVEAAGVERLKDHRLRREIVATQMVNNLVDLMGASFLHRVARDTGRQIDTVVAAWSIASGIARADDIRRDLARLESDYPVEIVYRWLFGLARVLEGTTRWTLANVDPESSVEDVVHRLSEGLERLRRDFAQVVTGSDRELFEERLEELRKVGVEGPLAQQMITLRFLPQLLDILRIAGELDADAVETATAYYAVAERFGIHWLQQMLRSGVAEQMWEKRLAQALMGDVQRAHREISRRVFQCRAGTEPIDDCLATYREARARETDRYVNLLEELRAADEPSLAGTAVAVRALVELAAR